MGQILAGFRDFGMWDQEKEFTDAKFKSGNDLQEGVSGLSKIDTTFENTVKDRVNKPASEYNSTDDCPDPDKSQDWRCW